MAGLREQKRGRTRDVIVSTAIRLFTERGFEQTTITEIAAQAEVGRRTFFHYFESKDDLLFADSEERITAARAAIGSAAAGESPAELLIGALESLAAPDFGNGTAALRLRLIREVPSVAGRAAFFQASAQRAIGQELVAAFPGRFDEVSSAALVGAFTGAVAGAVEAIQRTMPSASDVERRRALHDALKRALLPAQPGDAAR